MRSGDNYTDPHMGISTSVWDRLRIREKTHEQLKKLDASGSIHDILPTIESIAFDSLTYTIDEEMEQRMFEQIECSSIAEERKENIIEIN